MESRERQEFAMSIQEGINTMRPIAEDKLRNNNEPSNG